MKKLFFAAAVMMISYFIGYFAGVDANKRRYIKFENLTFISRKIIAIKADLGYPINQKDLEWEHPELLKEVRE